MNTVKFFIDNSLNTKENNFPGFIHRLGIHSNKPTDGNGLFEIGNDNEFSKLGLIIDGSKEKIPVWYYIDDKWIKADYDLVGPFCEKQIITLPKIVKNKK